MEKFESHFDASAELKNVRHLDDNEKELSKEDRLKLRKERLEDIKKKLADQMIGIAQTNAGLESLVFSGEELTIEKLNDFLEKSILVHKLAPWQIEYYKKAIERVVERNILVNRFFAENCEGKTDEEFFEFIFDKKPHGKILIEKGALCPIITCCEEDFSYIRSLNFVEKMNSGDNGGINSKQVQNIVGVMMRFSPDVYPKFVSFGSTLVVVKLPGNTEEKTAGTIIHEEKHVLDRMVFSDEKRNIAEKTQADLTKMVEGFNDISDEELDHLSPKEFVERFTIKPIEKQLDGLRKISEEIAREEILAYYKEGFNVDHLYAILSSSYEGTGYGVIDEMTIRGFEQHLETFSGVEQEKKIALEFFKDIHKKEEQDYTKHLSRGIDAIRRLENIGISRGEIIGLFETESLANWNKIFERIEKSDVYSKKRNIHSLELYLKSTEDNIESHKEIIAEALQQLEEPSERNHLYSFWQNYHKQKYATYEDALKFFLESNKKYLDESLARKRELKQQISELEK
ncbi:MAG TPA: hypothetical protein DEA43_02075 [Candidatus Moranbacteria bacterium]|nr:hypothetical protein [Candidatus Moranbacteria bacterium]HBT45651.1 hypothetical protein [Candidatus Moranbacteria bacterium]